MAKFLTTSGTSSCIEGIIMGAKKQLTLISPYYQVSKLFLERLKDASNKGIEIKIIYGKNELNEDQKESLAQLQTLKLYYLENLHAKCFYNEKEMVITSMNLYQYSDKNNREMGILIDAENDKELYESAISETNSIITHSKVRTLTSKYFKETRKIITANKLPPLLGYCIRCEIEIEYDPYRPYCYDCFCVWANFENPNFKENVCHCCGINTNPITMIKPQCNSCNKNYPITERLSM